MPLLQKLREEDITAGQECELKGEDTDVEEEAQPQYEQRYRSRPRRRFVNYNATGDPVRDSRMRTSASMDRDYQMMRRQPFRGDSSRRSSMSQYRYGAGDNREVRGRYGGRYGSQMFDGRYGYGNHNSMPQRRYSERGWSMSEYSDSDRPYRGSRSVTPRSRNHSQQWNRNSGPREDRMGPPEGRMGPREDRMDGENMSKRTPRRKSSRKDSAAEKSEGAMSPPPSKNRHRNRRKSSAIEKPAEDTSSPQSSGRRRSQSTNGRRRNGKEVAFTLRIRNIQAGVRVRDLKEALQERGIRPRDITWRGFRGFAFLHFPKLVDGKELEQESVIRSLQGLLVKPKIEREEDLFCVVEPAKPKPSAEVATQ